MIDIHILLFNSTRSTSIVIVITYNQSNHIFPLNHFQLNINSHFKDSKFTLDAGLVDENFTFIHTYIYIYYILIYLESAELRVNGGVKE